MNKYIKLSLLLCSIMRTPVYGQEIEVPSLRSLALDKAAELLHSELVKPQSHAQRSIILDYWQDKAGILYKPYYTNQQGQFAQSTSKNETITERFEQKYANNLLKIAEFADTDEIFAISHNGITCYCRNKKDQTSWTLADINKNKKLREFKGHTNWVEEFALTSDNTKAISISSSTYHTPKLWDLNTGECLNTLKGHSDRVHCVAITSDNTKAISASCDETLKLWDLNTGECMRTFKGHSKRVISVALSSDNTKALSTSRDSTIKLWDINTGECLRTFKGHTGDVLCVAFTSDNNKAISGANDASLKLWDLTTGECLRTLKEHRGAIIDIALSSDNTKALSILHDNTMQLWDINTGKCLSKINKKFTSRVIHKNLIAFDNAVYQLEDMQSKIYNMPQPKPCCKINTPHHLIDSANTGTLAGLIKLKASKNKKIGMGLATKSIKEKCINSAYLIKNYLVNAYKNLF